MSKKFPRVLLLHRVCRCIGFPLLFRADLVYYYEKDGKGRHAMSKIANQKTRILFLYQILLHESDEEHILTVGDMQDRLEANGYSANRKTVMDDLHALEAFGVDLISWRGKGGGYFIGEREFESAELKLLIDAVQSSRFISQTRSTRLIRKILGQASVYEGQKLNRQVYVAHRVKSENAELLNTVDAIHSAISENRQISFVYFDWNIRQERILRHGGSRYLVSPCMLSWDNEYYYLLAYDGAADCLKHYRVDKMQKTKVEKAMREGAHLWGPLISDPGQYENQLFGMFGGEETTVLLSVDASLAGVMIDRFGEDVRFLSDGEGAPTFRVSVRVRISRVFLSWILQFGSKVKILSPTSVRDALVALAREAIAQYPAMTEGDFSRKEESHEQTV